MKLATSKCAQCKSTTFEVVITEPAKSNFKLLFVQCAACGSVVGVLDFMNIGTMIHDQDQVLKRITAMLNR